MIEMGNVWDRTAEFVSDNLGPILSIALLTFLLPVAIANSLWGAMAAASVSMRIVMPLVAIALGLIHLWGQLVLVAMALEHGSQFEARALAVRRLPAALLIILLAALGTFLLLVLGWGVIYLAHAKLEIGTSATLGLNVQLDSLAAACILLELLFMLWVFARIAVLVPVIVNERVWISAFARAFRLTHGLTLKIVGVLLLYWIVSSVAQLAVQLVCGSIFRLVLGGGEPLSLSAVLTTIAIAIVQTIFVVLATVFTAKLYQALIYARAGLSA